MVKVLLDADTVLAALKGRLPVVMRLSERKPETVAVSVVSQVEVELLLRSQPRIDTRLAGLLKDFLGAVTVLPLEGRAAQQAVSLGAYLQQTGEPLSVPDLWLAATAIAHQRLLVTPRVATFARVPQLEAESWH